jgi:hypothetical protein
MIALIEDDDIAASWHVDHRYFGKIARDRLIFDLDPFIHVFHLL